MKEKSLKILIVSPFLPYPNAPHAGGKLIYFLISILSLQHSVYLLSRCFPGEEKNLPMLNKILKSVIILPTDGPVKRRNVFSFFRTVWSYYLLCREAKKILSREQFDLCQVEYTETGIFWKPTCGVSSILACHDLIVKPAFRRYNASHGLKRNLFWLGWRTSQFVERRSLRKFDCIITLSEEDREWGRDFYPGVLFKVLQYPGGIGFKGLLRKEIKNRILFVGSLNRGPNIEAVRYFWLKVWPSIYSEIPDIEFWIVGGGITNSLKKKLSGDKKVHLTGFVQNLEEIYTSAAICVAPILTGGGIIVKVLDSLAAGVPTVTTTFGNEGIRAKDGEEILIADSPESFSESVIRLLEDDEFRKRLGLSGKRYVQMNFSKDAFERNIKFVYNAICCSKQINN